TALRATCSHATGVSIRQAESLSMNRQFHLPTAAAAFVSAAVALSAAVTTTPRPAIADDCPNGGTVRFGVEPYDTSARLAPIYAKIGKMIADRIGCKVEIYVATGYKAEIEAIGTGKLAVGGFGPLGCVVADKVWES